MSTSSVSEPSIIGSPDLRGKVIDSQKKLTRYLKDQVKTDGSVRDVCKSRVLESSLMLHLLTIQGIYPNCQEQLTTYLTTQLDKEQNNKFHKALILGALGKSTSSNAQVVEDYMTGFQHFTASRKRVFFRAILAELQVIPYDSQYQIEDFCYRGYQSWVAAQICALKVLYAFGLNHRKWVNHDDVEFLLATQNNESIWEKHVLANIIILLALQKFPEHHHVVLKLVLISGSPDEIVCCLAQEFRISKYQGSTFATHQGKYTGKVNLTSGSLGKKYSIFLQMVKDWRVNLEESLAIGDSITDTALLEIVGKPVVFEPHPSLMLIAQEKGWLVTNRNDVVKHITELGSS